MKKNEDCIGLIDADSICYICSTDTLETSKKNVDSLISNILTMIRVKKFVLFLSRGKYFRHDFYPEYKANRPDSPLLFLKELKVYMEERYNAYIFDGAEADDLVAYYSKTLENSIVCSADKDVFNQIPGKHFNYKKIKFIDTTKEQAESFLWLQVLMGDSVDNIKGIPGTGEVKAAKILAKAGSPRDFPKVVYEAYLEYYKTSHLAMHYMQLNFKLVHLLNEKDEYLFYFKKVPLVDKICTI